MATEIYCSLVALKNTVLAKYGIELTIPAASLPAVTLQPERSQLTVELEEWFRLAFFDLPPYQFLDFEESVRLIDQMTESHDFEIDGQPSVWSDPNDAEFCQRIAGWSESWIPFANLHESGLVFVDLALGPRGTKGQVVHAWTDEMLLDVQGTSIPDWFRRIRQMIAKTEKLETFMVIPQEIRRQCPVYIKE